MNWRLFIRPEVEEDVAAAAHWYETREAGLGARFVEEIIEVWNVLAENPLLNSCRHPRKNIRWRYPEKFPYRVIYEVLETEHLVIVTAVLHAARADKYWKKRIGN